MPADKVKIPYVFHPKAAEREKSSLSIFAKMRLIFIAFLVFFGFSAVIAHSFRAFTADPYISVMTEKMRDYRDTADNYDVVFIGSSQTFRHIDAPSISSFLKQEGIDLKVYNFGVPAMSGPELRHAAEFILENKGSRLKHVIVQNPLRAQGGLPNMMTDRGRFFRYGEKALETMRDVNCYTGSAVGKLRRYKNNAQSLTAEQIGLGRLAQTLFPDVSDRRLIYNAGYRENDGYWPVEQDGSAHVKVRNLRTPMTDEIMQRYLRGLDDVIPTDSAATCRARQIIDAMSGFRDAGIGIMFFVSPNPKEQMHDLKIASALADEDPSIPILNFGSVDDYPELFEPELWFDLTHMNGRGARVLAGAIAPALIQEGVAG